MAVLSTSYDVESGVRTTLKNTISPTTVIGIQINYSLTITSGVLLFDPGTPQEEYISFGGGIVAGGITTLQDPVRNLTRILNDFSGTGTGFQHSGGSCVVELTNYHALYNLKANKDRANTFSAPQTIGGTNKLFLNDANSWIFDDGTDIQFRSSVQSQVSLSTLAAAAGVDEKVKISVTDTTSGYLTAKLTGGDGIALTIVNPGANEQIDIDLDIAANSGLQIVGGQLSLQLGSGIIISGGAITVDTTTLTNITATDIGQAMTYGESITAPVPVSLKGNGRVFKSNATDIDLTSTFIGIGKQNGVNGDSKNVAVMGPIVTISALNVNQGRYWPGETNPTSNSAAAVTGNAWKGQTYIPQPGQTNVAKISLQLTKNNSPAGNYLVKIFAVDGSNLPTGAALGTSTVAASALATGFNDFEFASAVTVVPGTTYAIVLNHSTNDAVNNYSWNYNNVSVYANGNGVTSSNGGGSWSSEPTNDYVFEVYFKSVSGEKVFLQDTAGTLGLIPGTNHQEVGIAITTTQMALNPQIPSTYVDLNFTATATATVDADIELGFRPRLVLAGLSFLGGNQGGLGFSLVGDPGVTLYNRNFLDENGGSNYTGANFGFHLLSYNSDTQNALGNTGYSINIDIQDSGPDFITIRRAITINGAPGSQNFECKLYILG